MIRYRYIITTQNPNWPVGQYFIVDEDREYCMPARPQQTGPRGEFTLRAEGEIEIPFDHTIMPFATEIGKVSADFSDDDEEDFGSDFIID